MVGISTILTHSCSVVIASSQAPVDDSFDSVREALKAELERMRAEIDRLKGIEKDTLLSIDELKRKKAHEEARVFTQATADKDGLALALQKQLEDQRKHHERDIAELERQKKELQEKAESGIGIVKASKQQEALARQKIEKDYENKLRQQQFGQCSPLIL